MLTVRGGRSPGAESHRFMDPTRGIIPGWGPNSWIVSDLGWKPPAAFLEAVETIQTSGDIKVRHDAFAKLLDAVNSDPPGTFLYQEAQLFAAKKDVD